MPKSLRCKIKKLCYNGTLTERERDRILKALEQEGVLDKIRAEIENLTYYCWEVSPRTVIDDVLEIIDKYKSESEDAEC